MDPDFREGTFSVLLEELDETPTVSDEERSKTLLERVEKWRIPEDKVKFLSDNILEKKKEIEVFRKALALAPQLGENLEMEISRRKAERDDFKVELLEGMLFEKIMQMEVLEKHAEELKENLSEKILQIEGFEIKADQLTDELGELRLEMKVTQRRAETDNSKVEFLLDRLSKKSQETEGLKTYAEELKANLCEKILQIEGLEIKVEELTDELVGKKLEMEVIQRKVETDNSKIRFLKDRLSKRCKEMELLEKTSKTDQLKLDELARVYSSKLNEKSHQLTEAEKQHRQLGEKYEEDKGRFVKRIAELSVELKRVKMDEKNRPVMIKKSNSQEELEAPKSFFKIYNSSSSSEVGHKRPRKTLSSS